MNAHDTDHAFFAALRSAGRVGSRARRYGSTTMSASAQGTPIVEG